MKLQSSILIIISALLWGCASQKPVSNKSPLDRWIKMQNQEYVRLVKKMPGEFKTLGIGSQASYQASLEDAKFNSTVMMPEKIGMIIQTIMVSDDTDFEMSQQSGSSIQIENLHHEQIGQFKYNGKVYVSVVSSKNKKEYFDELGTLNTLALTKSNQLEAISDKVLNHGISQQSQNKYATNKDVLDWTQSCDNNYQKWGTKNQHKISSMGWAFDTNEQMAFNKAKLLAGSLLPEKVEVYVEVVTQSLTKMGYSQQQITQTRINSLSKSKLNISNMETEKLSVLHYDGKYFVSVVTSKQKKEFDSFIRASVNEKTKLTTDFFEEAGSVLSGYY